MAKFKPWLKLWVEWLDDLKMLDLTLAEQGTWWRLCTLAQKCAADGALVKDNGAPLSLDEIADTLRIASKPDRKALDAMIQKMAGQGSLHWNSNTLVITHFAERQARTTSETREAKRERVRLHRQRQKQKGVTENPLQEPGSVPPLTTLLLEREAEADNSLQKTLHVTENSLRPSLALAKISKLYEQYFGIITPVLAEKFKDFVNRYRGPVDWIDLAFAEAVKYKNRRWQYVQAILYSWQEKGGPHAERRERGAEGGQPGADGRDPLKSYREQGWEVLGEEPETGNKD